MDLNCVSPPIHLFFFNKYTQPLALPTHGFHFCRFNQLQIENWFLHSQLRVPNHRSKMLFSICGCLNPRMQSPDCRLKSYMQIFNCARLRAPNSHDVQEVNVLPNKFLHATFSFRVYFQKIQIKKYTYNDLVIPNL